MKKSAYLLFFLLIVILLGCQKQEPHIPCIKQPFFIWGFSIEGFPISESSLEELEKETRVSAQLIQFYLQWPSDLKKFESIQSSLEAISNKKATPCITWEPMSNVNGKETMVLHSEILNGQYDPYLAHIANEVKAWNKPLIIRFAHEMNLNRYHWGTTLEQFNSESPNQYIKMFRYIVDFFRNQNVNQVLWAFCPNVESVPNESWNTPSHYYPGDDYVDILGMDGYNWDITDEIAKERKQSWTKPWKPFKEIFENLYQELKTINSYKPILVFETSCVERSEHRKESWVKNAIETAKEWGLIGIIWFQVKKEEDWRINQNSDYQYVSVVTSSINPMENWLEQYLKNHPSK